VKSWLKAFGCSIALISLMFGVMVGMTEFPATTGKILVCLLAVGVVVGTTFLIKEDFFNDPPDQPDHSKPQTRRERTYCD
jgi:hypothetical protein